jgi:hypothetical protein
MISERVCLNFRSSRAPEPKKACKIPTVTKSGRVLVAESEYGSSLCIQRDPRLLLSTRSLSSANPDRSAAFLCIEKYVVPREQCSVTTRNGDRQAEDRSVGLVHPAVQ